MVPELEKLGVEHITLPVDTKNPLKLWFNAKKLAQIAREKEAGVIHVRSRAPAWSVKWASRETKIPYIATYHGRYGTKPALKKLYNRVMVQGEKVIAVSNFIKNHLMEEYKVPEEKIVVIPRGADINLFDPAKITSEIIQDFLNEHNIPTDQPIISLVGRLTRMKGQLVLVDALKQMKQREITVLFVGGNAKASFDKKLQKELAKLPPEIMVRIFLCSST